MSSTQIRLAVLPVVLSFAACAPVGDDAALAPESPVAEAPRADEEPGDPTQPTETELAEARARLEAVGRFRASPQVARVAYNTVTAAQATEWQFSNATGTRALVPSGASLALRDNYVGSHLKYGERSWGINLVWSSAPSYTVQVRTRSGAAPRYGDSVALYVSGGGYVKYGSRSYGINLVWSSTPVYEWRLEGGTAGTSVYTNTPLRIFNTTESAYRGDNLVYCQRTWGINLAWARDCSVVPSLGRYRTEDIPGI